MVDSSFLISVISMAGLGLFFASVLAIADRYLKVEEDPRVAQILEALPGVDCGACGLPGCHNFAEKVASGEVSPSSCVVSDPENINKIGEILGIEVVTAMKQKTRVLCQGGREQAIERAIYQGVKDCKAATLVAGGGKGCIYGCLGYGNCARACPFDAISMNDNNLPVIDEDKCTGCGLCVPACPRSLITLATPEEKVWVGCKSLDKGGVARRLCKVACIACQICVKVCPREAIRMVNNLAVIDHEKCDNCEICVAKCPTNAIVIYGEMLHPELFIEKESKRPLEARG